MKLSLHFCEFILPKEYMYMCGQYVAKILGLEELRLNFDVSELHYTARVQVAKPNQHTFPCKV